MLAFGLHRNSVSGQAEQNLPDLALVENYAERSRKHWRSTFQNRFKNWASGNRNRRKLGFRISYRNRANQKYQRKINEREADSCQKGVDSLRIEPGTLDRRSSRNSNRNRKDPKRNLEEQSWIVENRSEI